MKKTNIRLLLGMLSITGVLVFGLMSFKESKKVAAASKFNSPLQSPCGGNPPGSFPTGAGFNTLSSNFTTRNFYAHKDTLNSTVFFSQSSLCYLPTVIAPWYTYQYIGNLVPAIRPSGTRVFSGANPGNPSQTVQFTLYSNGDLYMQQTGGTVMATAFFTSNTYTL